MFYKDGFFWGMHLIWWVIWFGLLGWIFLPPFGTSYPDTTEDDDPATILKIRFAKGEISKVEYEQSKELLKSDG